MEEQRKALEFKELSPEESELLASLFEKIAARILLPEQRKRCQKNATLDHIMAKKSGSPASANILDALLYRGKNQQLSARIGPKGYTFLKEYEKYAADVYNMELRTGDVFVTSYQRSGTTWAQELVWLVAKDLDYKEAEAVPLTHRYPFLELACYYDDDTKEKVIKEAGNTEKIREVMGFLSTPVTKILAGLPSPRFVKTHLPMSLLPPKLLDTAKVVYVARDPRDVVVSSFHHANLFKVIQFKASFKELWNAFRKDLYTLTPYFEHVKEAWALRNHPNMLFLFYEDLSKDLSASIHRVAEFLGKELTTEQVERLCDHLSIENFKNNASVNFEDIREFGLLDSKETFIRKGNTGGWRDYFDEEMQRDADRWIADNLRDSDLCFPSMEA